MNIELEIRKLKLDMITDTPNNIIARFEHIWSGIQVVKACVFNQGNYEYIFYKNELDGRKRWFFYKNELDGRFFASYYNYWVAFASTADSKSFTYSHYQYITKFLVEGKINEKIEVPDWTIIQNENIIENVLNEL